MRAFLISDATREGSQELSDCLSTVFDLDSVAPVHISRGESLDTKVVDRASFVAKHLREPTLGEIGCALAHRAAQTRLLKEGLELAAIFEDDARVLDPERLSRRLSVYEEVCSQPFPVVVNLNQDAIPRTFEWPPNTVHDLAQAVTPPYPATAYVVNRPAAAAFVTAQTPISSQADWPRTRNHVKFFVDRFSSVMEAKIPSSIELREHRGTIPWQTKTQVWSGLWYLKYRRQFPSFWHYVTWLPKARLAFHLDRMTARME